MAEFQILDTPQVAEANFNDNDRYLMQRFDNTMAHTLYSELRSGVQPNTYSDPVQIDGDFRNNQANITSISTTGDYISDMWVVDFSIGTVSVNYTPEIDAALGKGKIDIVLNNSFFSLEERIADLYFFNNKAIAIFVKVNSTTGLNGDMFCAISQVFGTGGSSTVQTLSNNQSVPAAFDGWLRFDLTVPTLSGKTFGTNPYAEIRVSTFGTSGGINQDISIERVRVVENFSSVVSTEIPDSIKRDENAILMRDKVLSYYERLGKNSSDTSFTFAYFGDGNNRTTGDATIPIKIKRKVKKPTLGSMSGNMRLFQGNTTFVVTNVIELAADTNIDTLTLRVSATGLTTGDHVLFTADNDNTAYIDIDARFTL